MSLTTKNGACLRSTYRSQMADITGFMPLVALCLRHFLADCIICMCVFDFRQAQALQSNYDADFAGFVNSLLTYHSYT